MGRVGVENADYRIVDLLARIPAKTGGNAADGDLRDTLTLQIHTVVVLWCIALSQYFFSSCPRGSRQVASFS